MWDIGIGLLTLFAFTYFGYKFPRLAFLLVFPAIIVVYIILEILDIPDSNRMCYGFLFPVTLLGIFFSKRSDEGKNWAQFLAKWFYITSILIGIIALLGTVSGVFFIFGGLVVCLFVRHLFIARRNRAANILLTIAASVKQSLPLTVSLNMEAGKSNKRIDRTYRRISKLLAKGIPLSESLRRCEPAVSAEIISKIKMAERNNRLVEIMKQIESSLLSFAYKDKEFKSVQPEYYFLLIVVVIPLFLGLMTFIMPTYAEVISDMTDGQFPMPKITMLMMNTSEWVLGVKGHYIVPFSLSIIYAILPFAVIYWIYAKIRRRKVGKPYFSSRIADRIRWYMPLFGWYHKNYATLTMIEGIHTSLEAGQTVDDAIEIAVSLDVNWVLRKRVMRWLEMIKRGDNIIDSAKKCKVGHAIVMCFDEELSTNDVPDTMELMESVLRSNYNLKSQLMKSIFWPCLTVVFGVLIGLVCYSIFAPMVAIVYAAMSWIP